MNRTRRELLRSTGRTTATVGAGAVGAGAVVGLGSISGCLDFAAGDGPQGPSGTPATLSCGDDEFERLESPFDEPVETRTVTTSRSRVELSTEGTSETYGSRLRLSLRNSGNEALETVGEHAYAIQRDTMDGWVDVRGSRSKERVVVPRDDESIDPGSGYNWSFRLREEELATAVPDLDLDVCPPLGSGTHRFVYWGLTDAPPIGVEFELVG